MRVVRKLSASSTQSQSWNRSNKGDMKKAIIQKKRELALIGGSGEAADWRRSRLIERELDDMLKCEEIFWRQWSRFAWLKDGEVKETLFQMSPSKAPVGFECNHALRRKVGGKNGFMALKLDMAKAYDRAQWCFLEDCHATYLGLPCLTRRSKRVMFDHVKQRVWNKLQSWSHRFFSLGGREVLLKAVIQSIPVYTMNLFRLPASLITDIHRMRAKFWWGGSGNKRKMHWCFWENLCKAKDEGV
ncbi:hypothetical protein Ddye_014716 [Dipteronia dyeriana]|uniref:Reverse transcriptase n=1 Tax=Dipteronia dyeriana TaxID=168575 RepID=A0AAD9X8S6_9ROSI|nr:hypothetical protein Ddye_014716 [Dipteronia dyeriana]